MSNTIQPDINTRLWRIARTLEVFTVEDLVVLGETRKPAGSAFLKRLLRRGLARKEGQEVRARRGRPVSKYRLLQKLTPELPQELRRPYERAA